jgi:hypothetical protein
MPKSHHPSSPVAVRLYLQSVTFKGDRVQELPELIYFIGFAKIFQQSLREAFTFSGLVSVI